MPEATVDVVIPTYNRWDSLRRTLDSFCCAAQFDGRYQAIVVDDGSRADGRDIRWDGYPYSVQCLRQENAGATLARNYGASHSVADVLVFVDDDIEAHSGMLETLVERVLSTTRVLAMATLIPVPVEAEPSAFATQYADGRIFPKEADDFRIDPEDATGGRYVHFSRCRTGVLAVRRCDFESLGGFQDPTGGWPNWDDVDFGYRAHLQGYRLWRSYQALAYHHDHSLSTLDASCERFERISYSAARLFDLYPELLDHFPSYVDKGYIRWTADAPSLILRKALRGFASRDAMQAVMRRLRLDLERHRPNSRMLALLYRWILSSHMYSGYRSGLHALSAEVL